jgi:hypothetical protein
VPSVAVLVGGEVYWRDEDLMYPEIVLAGQVDLGARGDGGALVHPWAGNAGRAVDGDLAARREAEVCSIVAADQGGIVGVVADAAAGHWVGVAIDRGDGVKEGQEEVGTHLELLLPEDLKKAAVNESSYEKHGKRPVDILPHTEACLD